MIVLKKHEEFADRDEQICGSIVLHPFGTRLSHWLKY
jgi:hypothetical protein